MQAVTTRIGLASACGVRKSVLYTGCLLLGVCDYLRERGRRVMHDADDKRSCDVRSHVRCLTEID